MNWPRVIVRSAMTGTATSSEVVYFEPHDFMVISVGIVDLNAEADKEVSGRHDRDAGTAARDSLVGMGLV